MSQIRILLIEDDPDWIKTMTQYLHQQSDLLVAGAAMNKEEAITLAKTLIFDIALIDINLSGIELDGIEVMSEIVLLQPVKAIMLTGLNDEKLITQSFSAGAVNFVFKTEYKNIPSAIRSTYKNTSPIEVLLKDYERLKQEEQLRILTTTEREIFDLAEEGLSTTQISKALHKSDQTIKNQIHSILKKIGASRLREAVEKIRKSR